MSSLIFELTRVRDFFTIRTFTNYILIDLVPFPAPPPKIKPGNIICIKYYLFFSVSGPRCA